MGFVTVVLNSSHNRKQFSCGNDMLDNYFQKQANQDVKRKLSVCFVLPDSDEITVKGYYTLSNYSIPLDIIPETLKRKMPRSYTSLPTTLLGRLAIASDFKGKGLGKLLLIDALKRSYDSSRSLGSFAVIVDPIDDNATRFYSKYGFNILPDSGKMFLPMKTISQLFYPSLPQSTYGTTPLLYNPKNPYQIIFDY